MLLGLEFYGKNDRIRKRACFGHSFQETKKILLKNSKKNMATFKVIEILLQKEEFLFKINYFIN